MSQKIHCATLNTKRGPSPLHSFHTIHWRILSPCKLILVDKKHQAPDAMSFIFHPERPAAWQAGQFTVLNLPHPGEDDRGEERYFTISSAPHEEDVMITTRFDSEHSSTFKDALARLPLGAVVEAAEPEGDFLLHDPMEEVVFIAGGTGINPFRSILLDLDHRGLPVDLRLLYANRDEHLIYRDELEALARRHPGLKLHYFISPRRIDEAALRELISDHAKPLFYVSGPDPMVERLEKTLLPSLGVPAHHVKAEYFSGYELEEK